MLFIRATVQSVVDCSEEAHVMPALSSIAVIGLGGVGGYFGGKLCRLLESNTARDSLSIAFIARGEHLRAIQADGLQLSSEADGEVVCRPTLATDDFASLPPLDLGLVCVKEFDLPAALTALRPKIGDHTVILPMLNGVDVHARIRATIDNGIALPACVYVGTHIERPGRVVQRGGACKILCGPDPERTDFDPAPLLALLHEASIRAEWTPDIQAEIWKKFIYICAFGLVTAAHDRTLGEVLADEALSRNVQAIMHEAIATSRELGVTLPADIAATSFAKARDFPPEAKTSLQRDFESAGRRDERDLFAGSLIRLAAQTGVETPATIAAAATLVARKPVS